MNYSNNADHAMQFVAVLRWGLYPAFLLVSEGYVHNDWLVYALMFILAYTNGLTVTYFSNFQNEIFASPVFTLSDVGSSRCPTVRRHNISSLFCRGETCLHKLESILIEA